MRGKKENFQLSSKLPAGFLKVQGKPCHRENSLLQKKGIEKGRRELHTGWELRTEPKFRIWEIFIHLSNKQKQPSDKMKICDIFNLKSEKSCEEEFL